MRIVCWFFLGCGSSQVPPQLWPEDGCSADGAIEVRARDREQTRLQLDDEVIIEVAASWPSGPSCVGAVVWVPPGFEAGQSLVDLDQSRTLVDAGVGVVAYDPRGRGESEGQDDANGSQGQDDLAALLRWVASQDMVDPSRVVLATRSFGGAAGAGALARHPDLAVRGWLDIEGPGWLRLDLEHAPEHNQAVFDAYLDDVDDVEAWWSEREPAGHAGKLSVPYWRAQGVPDHALDWLGHARAMVNEALTATEVIYNGQAVTEQQSSMELRNLAHRGRLDPEGDEVRTYLVDLVAL